MRKKRVGKKKSGRTMKETEVKTMETAESQ